MRYAKARADPLLIATLTEREVPVIAAAHIVIIGAGIAGLAHAWAAAERGFRVTVFERSPAAAGASVRNFGMLWPVGQPAGAAHALALRSRERWTILAAACGLWLKPCGSIHLAHREDEWAVLREFAAAGPELGYDCQLLSPDETLERSPGANPRHLLGGLYSPTEGCVNPRTALAHIATWLGARHGVRFEFGHTVIGVEADAAIIADGRRERFDAAVVCGGSDIDTLFPGLVRSLGLRLCKLQMLRTTAQPDGWNLGTHLASGLTLRHYRNFAVCPGLSALTRRVADESPELDRFGIHVMASQNDAGEITLGDSHEYGEDIEVFDKTLIDDLIIRELRKVVSLPEWTLNSRWHGIYAKHPTEPYVVADPIPRVRVFTGLGGAGMTMSLGAADHVWDEWSKDLS